MELVKNIHHEIYNYEIINNSDTTCVFFSEKKHESFSSYKEIVAAAIQNNVRRNFKSEYFVTVYYKDEDGVCNWLKPVDIIANIYLSGKWATTKYLKRVCEKWNLNVDDFKIGYNDFGEIYYKYSNKDLKF